MEPGPWLIPGGLVVRTIIVSRWEVRPGAGRRGPRSTLRLGHSAVSEPRPDRHALGAACGSPDLTLTLSIRATRLLWCASRSSFLSGQCKLGIHTGAWGQPHRVFTNWRTCPSQPLARALVTIVRREQSVGQALGWTTGATKGPGLPRGTELRDGPGPSRWGVRAPGRAEAALASLCLPRSISPSSPRKPHGVSDCKIRSAGGSNTC